MEDESGRRSIRADQPLASIPVHCCCELQRDVRRCFSIQSIELDLLIALYPSLSSGYRPIKKSFTMPFKVLMFATRKQGLSPQEFIDYYENKHVPLIKSLTGNLFPASHTRHYIGRAPADGSGSGATDAPWVVMGDASEVTWDSMAILTFKDDEHFNKAMQLLSDEEMAAKLAADEENFVDRSKLKAVIIGEVSETKNDSLQ